MTALPRRFHLWRDVDATGASGTGHVADGALWPDGTATVHWRGEDASDVLWLTGIAGIRRRSCHDGLTRIVWDDPEPDGDAPQTTGDAIAGVQSWMALDLHRALGRLADMRPDLQHQGHRSHGDWWADLTAAVRQLADAEVLRRLDPDTPHGPDTRRHRGRYLALSGALLLAAALAALALIVH